MMKKYFSKIVGSLLNFVFADLGLANYLDKSDRVGEEKHTFYSEIKTPSVILGFAHDREDKVGYIQ